MFLSLTKARYVGWLAAVAVSCIVLAAALAKWNGTQLSGRSAARAPQAAGAVAGVQAVPDWQEVPEMAEILGSDQTKRLEATRRLAERVGVEQALEIVERSPLPHTGEGHLAVHQIGFYAFKLYGPDSILRCKDYFLYACYHGVLIEAASNEGLKTVAAMADKCKGSAGRYFQCAHAVGHSLLAMWNYDLPEALEDCDEVFEKEAGFPGALSSCHNGAFMENLFGVHDWGTDNAPKREWLQDDDPYFPCTAFEAKYQQGCWLNQAARIYQMNSGNIAKTREVCEQTGNRQYTEWCVDNLARQIHPLTEGSVEKVYALCQQVGPFWYEKCVVVNAGSYYSVGDPQAAITVCRGQLSPPAKSDCYQTVLGQLVADVNRDQTAKEALCRQMDAGFSEHCLQQL